MDIIIFSEENMFVTRRIKPSSKDIRKIKKLYIEAFPENERFSFSMMIKNESGNYETFGFYQNGDFCGFALIFPISSILQLFRNSGEKALVQRPLPLWEE